MLAFFINNSSNYILKLSEHYVKDNIYLIVFSRCQTHTPGVGDLWPVTQRAATQPQDGDPTTTSWLAALSGDLDLCPGLTSVQDR